MQIGEEGTPGPGTSARPQPALKDLRGHLTSGRATHARQAGGGPTPTRAGAGYCGVGIHSREHACHRVPESTKESPGLPVVPTLSNCQRNVCGLAWLAKHGRRAPIYLLLSGVRLRAPRSRSVQGVRRRIVHPYRPRSGRFRGVSGRGLHRVIGASPVATRRIKVAARCLPCRIARPFFGGGGCQGLYLCIQRLRDRVYAAGLSVRSRRDTGR